MNKTDYFKTAVASLMVFSNAALPYLSTSALFFSPWVRQPAPPIQPPMQAIPSIKLAWRDKLSDPILADAICDRIVHDAYTILMNSSNSISATITDEHGENILYYQYRTAPDLTTKRENPMQYGACRMRIDGNEQQLRGSYWTDRPSRGDMIWGPVIEEKKHVKNR